LLDPHADVDDGGAVATDVRLDLVQHADTSVLVHRVHRRGWGTFGAHAGRGYDLGASLARRLAAACRPWAGVHGVEPVAQLVVVAWEVELHRRASSRLITLQLSPQLCGDP
jgi:hypothetical protein